MTYENQTQRNSYRKKHENKHQYCVDSILLNTLFMLTYSIFVINTTGLCTRQAGKKFESKQRCKLAHREGTERDGPATCLFPLGVRCIFLTSVFSIFVYLILLKEDDFK